MFLIDFFLLFCFFLLIGLELEKDADDEAKAQMTQNTQRDLGPGDEHRDDATSHYVTEEPKEDTEKDKEENKSADMRELEELPTSHAETGAETTPMNYFFPLI